VLRHPVSLTGSGRTDAGVHAWAQTAHFDTPLSIQTSRLIFSTNAILPADIRIISAEIVADDFHARYHSKGKIYHYHLHLGAVANPIVRLYCTPVYGKFDLALFQEAAKFFIGTHNFASFANQSDKHTSTDHCIRTLIRLDVLEEERDIRLEFEGNGFLYKMVRNITGTLLEVAKGRRSPNMNPLLKGGKRSLAGAAAPAQGLFLKRVIY
jgi:tRNA pseudouridine38-40 synthase